MIKEFGKYTVNGREAVFNATFEKKIFQKLPVAIFTFNDGAFIKVTYNIIKGETTFSEPMTPEVKYSNGEWVWK